MEKVAYFDNAATTFPKPECVYNFTDQFYRECGVNVGRGQHKLASRASALVQETRELLLELFHCPAKKVVFTHTATEAIMKKCFEERYYGFEDTCNSFENGDMVLLCEFTKF